MRKVKFEDFGFNCQGDEELLTIKLSYDYIREQHDNAISIIMIDINRGNTDNENYVDYYFMCVVGFGVCYKITIFYDFNDKLVTINDVLL